MAHADDVAPGVRKRPLRADASRNEDALLEAAKGIFASRGVDAPVRDIADAAGVGLGTFYRRFPKRSDLIAAVFRREVDTCAGAAPALAAEHPPAAAVREWLLRYVGFIGTKKGLAAALHSGDPAYAGLPDYFRSRFEPALAALVSAAAQVGDMRGDIPAYDLLRAVAKLAVAPDDRDADYSRRMLDLLLDGMRSVRPHGAS